MTDSSRSGWPLTAAVVAAAALAATIVTAVEWQARSRGHTATVLDDRDLWAQHRARLARQGERAVALLGTSRMVYGIDPRRLQALLPGYEPVMLAINGSYPAAVLRDLAQDRTFAGLVVVDVDAAGLRASYRELQADHVEHFHREWGPSRAVHRRLLTEWQRRWVVADPAHGAVAALRRLIAGLPPPPPRHATVGPDRAGWLDFRRVDVAALRDHFARERRSLLQRQPAPAPDQWLADLAPVAQWVRTIRSRGGQVLFFAMPTSGEHRAVDDAAYPPALYWNRLADAVGAPVVHADEVPSLASIATPDGSHVDSSDRGRLTAGLAEAMRRRLVLRR